jgi:hypothetical protein
MTTLHLGVVDVGYTGEQGSTTTGDVAQYLEDRYHIMRVFVETHEEDIAKELVNQVAGAIESIAQGRRISPNWKPAMGKIEQRFREFLDSGELNRMLPEQQQSAAAAAGINHRKKNPNTEKSRQAFIDTGLYQASFRCWVT